MSHTTPYTDADLMRLIDHYLLFLRGRGPEPDLSGLPPNRRAEVADQLKIVAALADRHPALPPIDADPVAAHLGLFDDPPASASPPDLSRTSAAAGWRQVPAHLLPLLKLTPDEVAAITVNVAGWLELGDDLLLRSALDKLTTTEETS